LAIEALVNATTTDPDRLTGLLPEHQRICLLCRETKSVAEVSALLSIPLGVTRILIADVAEAGLVTVHQSAGDEPGGRPDHALLERVLSGLRGDPPADRRFVGGHRALVDGLDDVLDIEGGLHEVLLQSRHEDAVDGLDDVLDIEGGLHEVLWNQRKLDS
jgi:hypothetical protein